MEMFLLDTNSLIDAHVKWYPPHIFPRLWDELLNNSNIKLIKQVKNEIQKPEELQNWTKEKYQKDKIDVDNDREIMYEYSEMFKWFRECNLWSEAGYSNWEKVDKADPWLIATAKVHNCTIVTMDGNGNHSLPNKNSRSNKEPKISAVAAHYGMETIPIYKMIKVLNLRF